MSKIKSMDKLVKLFKKTLWNHCLRTRDIKNRHVFIVNDYVSFTYEFKINRLYCSITDPKAKTSKQYRDYLLDPRKFIATMLAYEEKHGRFHRTELEKLIIEWT